ncbi:MAG: ATP-dependent helicase DinG [Clostridia bacterium]|nr:ATP-dependent helicase DinG [Clostridia bacterium]
MLPATYVVFDLETTGLDPEKDHIIEIGAIKIKDGRVVEEMSSLVHLEQALPPAITRLTGIEPEMLKTAPPLKKVLDDFLGFISTYTLVSHNANFDIAFLNRAFGRSLPNPVLDTLELARILWPRLTSYSLESLSTELSLTPRRRHRALADAQVTVELLLALWQRTLGLPWPLLMQLNTLNLGQDNALASWLQAAARLNKDKPWEAPDEVATGKSEESPLPENGQKEPLSFEPANIAALLEPGGLIASFYPNYEYRPQQVEVLTAVAGAFAEGSCLAVEAGTGIGKSLAYLLPAIIWAKFTGKRVAVATHTINLQEQLWQKDIPRLQAVLPFKFGAALLKGRSHYLCRRKYGQWLDTMAVQSEAARRFAMRLLVWLTETETGDWDEIKLLPQEEQWRHYLAAHTETCRGEKCPWYHNGCFLMSSRRRAEASHILILNHSLLMEDAKLHNQLLPPYPYLIIDEAHHIEEVATEHLGVSCGHKELSLLVQATAQSSLLRQIELLAQRLAGEEARQLKQGLAKVLQVNAQLAETLQKLNFVLQPIFQEQTAWRLAPPLTEFAIWEEFLTAAGNLEFYLDELQNKLNDLICLTERIGALPLSHELEGIVQQARESRKNLSSILDAESEETVTWVEARPQGEWLLRAAPLLAGPMLAELIYSRKEAVILTSATLTVGGEFAYFRERSGLGNLPSERLRFLKKPSPFNYDKQVFLGVVTDLPNPGHLSDADYAAALAPALQEIITLWGKQTLILFTSHRLLQATYRLILAPLEEKGYTVLAQGIDGNRSHLLTEFCRHKKAVLLGANSFWEGVDLPGDLLSCILIPRLPFPAPNHPLTAARLEYLASRGQDPFLNLSLPQASIRLAQGFGRLIRRATDKGAIIILDKRLISRRYGKYFLSSLPIQNFYVGQLEELIARLDAWREP